MSPLRQYRLGRTVAVLAGVTALGLSEVATELGLLLTVPAGVGLYGMFRGVERGA